MLQDNLVVHNLAKRIHDFLAEYDPAFGYAMGVPGQQNEIEWCETIANALRTQRGFELWTSHISELVVEIPGADADGDELLGDLFAA